MEIYFLVNEIGKVLCFNGRLLYIYIDSISRMAELSSHPPIEIPRGRGEGMRKDLEQVFPWMTFYCLRNDRGRISMDFGPRQLAGTNDTSEASNRFHASRLFPSRRHLGMAQGDRL